MKKLMIIFFMLITVNSFSDVIREKLDSSQTVITFPFFLITKPFIVSSGTEFENLGVMLKNGDLEEELRLNVQINEVLKKEGVKKHDKIDIDETEYGIFLSKKNKIILFITRDEKYLNIFGKGKRE